MTDPAALPTIAVTSGGITLLGVATGLQPELLLAGAAGGWWALTYAPPARALARINRISLSSTIAAWTAPPATAWAAGTLGLPDAMPAAGLQILIALGVGLIALDVLGRGLLGLARARLAKPHEVEK
jgi:hypothetical protein